MLRWHRDQTAPFVALPLLEGRQQYFFQLQKMIRCWKWGKNQLLFEWVGIGDL